MVSGHNRIQVFLNCTNKRNLNKSEIMKKIALCLMTTFLSLTFLPVKSYATTTSISDSLVVAKLAGRDDFLVRSTITRKNDLSNLNQSDKNNSRGTEAVPGRNQDNGMNKGMYVSRMLIPSYDIGNHFDINNLKIKIMGNLLYVVAVILLIAWAIGFFAYSTGGIIHILLVIAIIAVLLRIIQGKKVI